MREKTFCILLTRIFAVFLVTGLAVSGEKPYADDESWLYKLGNRDETSEVRLGALDSLAKLGAAEEDIAPILLSSLRDAETEENTRMAVLLTLSFHREFAQGQTFPRTQFARLLLDILKDGEPADQTRSAALDLLPKINRTEEDVPLTSTLIEVLKNAEDTDALRMAVLEGAGASYVSAEKIDKKADNPYPETRQAIDRYKEFAIKKFHENISAYRGTVTEISTLEELFQYAGKSGVHVKMKPGTYHVTLDNYKEYVEPRQEDGDYGMLEFTGTDSFFDLRGVEIKFDTAIPSQLEGSVYETVISGDNLIIRGLNLETVGNTPPEGLARVLMVRGNSNLLQEIKIISRGSYPYGYFCGLTAQRAEGVGSDKRAALQADGFDNYYIDCEIYHYASGHILPHGWYPRHTFIDCHIEGTVRLTDDILKGRICPAVDKEALTDLPEDFDLTEHLEPGRIIPLNEEAFRAYKWYDRPERGPGRLKVLGSTIKKARSAFQRGDYESIFISNTKVHASHAFRVTAKHGDTKIVNSQVDLHRGSLLSFKEWEGAGAEAEIIVVPPDPEIMPAHREEIINEAIRSTVGRSGFIRGDDHKVFLKAGEGLDVETTAERAPLLIGGNNHFIRNETGLPIILQENARNCRIITNGEVTDNGENNKIEYTDAGTRIR